MLVEFAYSQELEIEVDDVCDLIVAADYYGFLTVITECTQFLEQKIIHDNCLAIWKFGIQYNFQILEQIAFDYILKYFQEICHSNEFLNLNDAEFNQIIISEWLNAEDLEIQEVTDAWYKHRLGLTINVLLNIDIIILVYKTFFNRLL